MSIDRIFYNNRLSALPAHLDNLLSWRPALALKPSSFWPQTLRQPKTLMFATGLVILVGLVQIVVGGIKNSPNNFFARFGHSTGQLANRTARAGTSAVKTISRPAPSRSRNISGAAVNSSSGTYVELARQLSARRFGDQHWSALHNLWASESAWDPNARNPSSGACGIPQALPCSKIPDMSPEGQVRWGIDYIGRRYGNPSRAWLFWQTHNWY